jgi:hypothetical protein
MFGRHRCEDSDRIVPGILADVIGAGQPWPRAPQIQGPRSFQHFAVDSGRCHEEVPLSCSRGCIGFGAVYDFKHICRRSGQRSRLRGTTSCTNPALGLAGVKGGCHVFRGNCREGVQRQHGQCILFHQAGPSVFGGDAKQSGKHGQEPLLCHTGSRRSPIHSNELGGC